MKLNQRSITELRKIINGDEEKYAYRNGYELVKFFNDLGFNDEYGEDFPSRWMYTENKLEEINETMTMEKCIKKTFSVIDFIEDIEQLDNMIIHFNKYLAFDKYQIRRVNDKIIIENISEVIINSSTDEEQSFLETYSDDYDISLLNLDYELEKIIQLRILEIKSCLNNNSPLAAIFLMGSTLEGILFGFSKFFEEIYLEEGKKLKNDIKKLEDISLNDLIIISFNHNFLKNDVDQFSHSLRKFRNYIHPTRQLKEKFNPDMHTARICWAVLQASIYQLSEVDNSKHD